MIVFFIKFFQFCVHFIPIKISSKHKIGEIIDIIKKEGIEIEDISTDDGDLEDVFFELTKN